MEDIRIKSKQSKIGVTGIKLFLFAKNLILNFYLHI
jgi:hypothetical protein